MSDRRISRALARLAGGDAVLRLDGDGPRFGVFIKGDRRRRALLRLDVAEVRALEADGAIVSAGEGEFRLGDAGHARVARERAEPGEAFAAQHRPLVARSVIDRDGDVRCVRGVESEVVLRRLAALRGPNGAAWLNGAELAAAGTLRADWAVGEVGLVKGSDWSAAPIGSGARGASNAQEMAMARRCDARRRVADALARLAAPLRRVVERVCLYEEGLEAMERAEGWPSRSGKLALKLGLAQLAATL